MTIKTSEIPYVDEAKRIVTEVLENGFFRITIHYGFKEEPNVPHSLKQAFSVLDLEYDLMNISFFVSRERLIPSLSSKMSTWREKLFVAMQKIPALSVIFIKSLLTGW